MRIAQLNLLRYGKFTDCPISLPQSGTDFHLIVGPNEAGKSTLRNAILDLFFGIEPRSKYNFLHHHNDMKLSASIQQDGKVLDFQRRKGQKQTLQSPSGDALADNVLSTFLGTIDRPFFDQMFGLDHEKLVKGGDDILSSSNDIGQILFQSAAGIGSLGAVRDALVAEAEGLWAPKRANTREYYIASDELAKAEAALKSATVRTKDWSEARSKVEKITTQLDLAQGEYRELEGQRIRLERIRRVASALAIIRESTESLDLLGDVVLLPSDASKTLADAELEIAKAEQERRFFDGLASGADEKLKEIHLDQSLTGRELDIQALSERRQSVRNHESDIGKRQEEIRRHWENIESCVRQLGWELENESILERRLPSLPIRTAIKGLIARYGVVEQAVAVALEAEAAKTLDLESIDEQIQNLSFVEVSAVLRAELGVARNLGDVKGLLRRLESQVGKAIRELNSTTIELGQWNLGIDTLRHLSLPSTKEIEQLQTLHATAELAPNSLREKLADLQSDIRDLELDIKQYRTAHHPVTLAELTDVRVARDIVWASIKAGEAAVSDVAAEYETKVISADDVSDNRHDKAQEVNALQTKLDSLERSQNQALDFKRHIETASAELVALEKDWEQKAIEMGLPEIPLLTIGTWKVAREKALAAAVAVTEVQLALDEQAKIVDDAKLALHAALVDAGSKLNVDIGWAPLIVEAAQIVDNAAEAKVRKDELQKQRRATQLALTACEPKVKSVRHDLDTWKTSWLENVVNAGLSAEIDVGAADGALSLFAQIAEKLGAIQELRRARIETMQQDLDDFAREAIALTSTVASDLHGQSAAEVAKELSIRMAKAKTERTEFDRLSLESTGHKEKAIEARSRIDSAEAGIRPLMRLANISTNDELRLVIGHSDQHRTITDTLAAAKKSAREGGDGLPFETLVAELESADVVQVPTVLGDINRQREELLSQQNALSAERANAIAEFEKIAGQDEAARAESARQEALARMANAAERYIKVFTAGRLLKWAIDRYRETKQGPMLARAGKIFSSLTLGSFDKLVVDFDSDPLALEGRRVDGTTVGVTGMSDGTRDQLYLALRLAALEIHLEHTQPLPFIADDLFINYDDARSKAGFEALAKLAEKTQVIFLSHHDHLIPAVKSVFGNDVNVVCL